MLSTTPPKWTQDWYPEEFQVRKYIFDTWRDVCTKFWYQEYLWPLVENVEIWKAKSWEDVWWNELTLITNREWKISDLALRPEMTPTVTRMVTKNFTQMPKPVRYFSIANFYRNERPQRWRNREFWQLNVDMFSSGETYTSEDLEILQISVAIMQAFKAPKESWILNINHREIINFVLEHIANIDNTKHSNVIRTMDKREKMKLEDFEKTLFDLWLDKEQTKVIVEYMSCENLEDLTKKFPEIKDSLWFTYLSKVLELCQLAWIRDFIQYKSSLIRGFDYYNWMVFEIFDLHPENSRALFGGWRYNGLSWIFWYKDEMNAIWFAPWDETTKLFLESWGLIDKIKEKTHIRKLYIPILDEALYADVLKLAWILRKERNVVIWQKQQWFGKAMKFADKSDFDFVVIYWEEEKSKWVYKVKDMKTGKERDFWFEEFERFCTKKLNQG